MMDEQNQNTQLPTGWVLSPLGEIQLDNSRSILPSDTPSKMFELYSVPNFVEGKPELVSGAEIGSNKKTVEVETVLLCGINPRINRVWIVGDFSPHTKIASTEWRQFAKQEGIDPKYLRYFMQTDKFREFLASNASGVGGSLMRVQNNTFASYPFPVAPTPEQYRIVAKIEQLFSDLDAGVAALEQTKQQLKRYRQSVLQAAVTGKLTAEWRAAHQHELEPASVLLERIRAERAAKQNGKQKDMSPLDTSGLGGLPAGWEWAKGTDVFYYVTSGSRWWAKYYAEEGALFIRVGNLDHDSISLDLTKVQRVAAPEGAEKERTRVKAGDILVSVTADVGMIALVPENIAEAYTNQHVALARPVESIHRPYLAWFLASRGGGQRQFRALQRGATKMGLGLDDILALAIPLPSMMEQVRIVEEVERRLSVADQIEKTIDISLQQAEHLRQSILKRAFAGKLVPQDPTDEPAEKLLERIRATREHQTDGKPKQLSLINGTPKKARRRKQ